MGLGLQELSEHFEGHEYAIGEQKCGATVHTLPEHFRETVLSPEPEDTWDGTVSEIAQRATELEEEPRRGPGNPYEGTLDSNTKLNAPHDWATLGSAMPGRLALTGFNLNLAEASVAPVRYSGVPAAVIRDNEGKELRIARGYVYRGGKVRLLSDEDRQALHQMILVHNVAMNSPELRAVADALR
ncbi:MAG: hypothetical protein AAF654_06385 [Myxococcota bacterium]